MRYASSTATAASGMLSSLGNSIRWEVRQVDGGYAIRSASDPTKYLAVSSNPAITTVGVTTVQNALIPSTCKWKITPVGGLLLKSAYNNAYLYLDGTTLKTSTTLGAEGTSTYNSRVWRCASVSYYGNTSSFTRRELSPSFYAYDLTLDVCDIESLTINKIYSDVLWASPNDFIITINGTNIAQITSNNEIEGFHRGNCSVTVMHKVTNKTSTRSSTITVASTYASTISRLADLYQAAVSYDSTSFAAALRTFQFIRRGKYNNEAWTTVAGNVDSQFISYIETKYPELYRYFTIEKNEEYYYTDPAGGGYIDFPHLCATLNGLIYDSTGFKAFIAGEENIDNLCGWAGDLQTLCIEVLRSSNHSNDYETVYSVTYQLIGDPNHSMSMMDLLADTDAYNISQLLNRTNSNLISAFTTYYRNQSGNRFTLFTNGYPKQQIYDCVRKYTTNTFLLWQDWPLLNGYDITNTQSNAIAMAFTDFIWEKIQNESFS